MKIGIDLGTTNSALAYWDPSSDDAAISVFEIPQFTAPGRLEKLRTLPSFLYLADQTSVGAYAREQGALTPTRSVHSAKSWLSNPDVDRSAKILPWEAQPEARELSPVEVSAAFLRHIREAWDTAHPETPLAAQDIVLTVPASSSATSAAAPATSPSSRSPAPATSSSSPAPLSANTSSSAAITSTSPSPGSSKPNSANSSPSASAQPSGASAPLPKNVC